MRTHRQPKAPAAPRRTASPPVLSALCETVLRLQRQAGNAATEVFLQRQTATVSPAVAAANAEATDTSKRITAVFQEMLRSTNAIVRNTAQLYTGSSPRMSWTPMTRRSDSAAIATQLGTTGTREYFFTGLTQPAWTPGSPPPPGTRVFEPAVGGTIDGNTALIRGRDTSGVAYPDTVLKSMLVHETSHVLVKSYGEHPDTATDSGSFDRYKDEFRAYFVDPFDTRFAGLRPDARATAIRTHLVGTSATSPNPATHAYADLQRSYWGSAAFRTQVRAHTRPDGLNLTSSPRLDRLFTLLTQAASDPSKVDETVSAIARLPVAERSEAASATLVRTLGAALGTAAETRIRRALEAPTTAAYTGALNPARSPRITAFYDALIRGEAAGIKTAYRGLSSADRLVLQMNPAVLRFIDHHVASERVRACSVALVNTQSTGQYNAVDRFIGACLDALADILLNSTNPTGPPPALLDALRAMAFDTRIGFYRLNEDARVQYVEILPPTVRRPIIRILRGEQEP